MEHVHHKLLDVIGMIQQHSSSNENKKLMPSANALFGMNFDILNTTLFQFITRARLTLVDDTTKDFYSTNCSCAPSVRTSYLYFALNFKFYKI